MLDKPKFLFRKHVHAVTWTVAFIGMVCLSVLLSGLGLLETGKVHTVLRPQTGAIESPGSGDIPGGSAPEGPVQGAAADASCEDPLLMVGPDHTLTEDYVPPDLVYLSSYGITARGAEDMLRQEAATQLSALVSDAARDGVEVLVASGYRSYWEQNGTFEWFKQAYGEDAGKLSVPPGQSEHQLGTAVDFASSEVDYELVNAFARTSAGMWLKDHGAQYGFVLSYGKGREAVTGVSYEPWHYRYIGVENALKVEAAGGNPMPSYREGVPPCYES